MPSMPSSAGGHVPILPAILPPLVWPPMASKRHFCARARQDGAGPKKQNRRKCHLQTRRTFLAPISIPTFPYHKTPHRSPQSASQRIKQPRPTPPGASRGLVICCGPGIARRSGPCQRPTRRSGGRRTARRYTPRGAAPRQPGT